MELWTVQLSCCSPQRSVREKCGGTFGFRHLPFGFNHPSCRQASPVPAVLRQTAQMRRKISLLDTSDGSQSPAAHSYVYSTVKCCCVCHAGFININYVLCVRAQVLSSPKYTSVGSVPASCWGGGWFLVAVPTALLVGGHQPTGKMHPRGFHPWWGVTMSALSSGLAHTECFGRR